MVLFSIHSHEVWRTQVFLQNFEFYILEVIESEDIEKHEISMALVWVFFRILSIKVCRINTNSGINTTLDPLYF